MFPEWCEKELATCVIPDKLPKYVEMKWDFAEITNTAQTGDATKATPEKGEKMTKVLVDAVVEAIKDLDSRNWDYTSTESETKL